TVRLYGHSGKTRITRDLRIFSTGTLSEGLTLSKDSTVLVVPGCQPAFDTVRLGSFGCGGMMLDSVLLPTNEITITNSLPIPIDAGSSLYFRFMPDSGGNRSLLAHLYAHAGLRHYDTTIAVNARSTEIPLLLLADSMRLAFPTKYCKSTSKFFGVAVTGCDTV